MSFYEHVGKLALGSRVRALASVITQDAQKIYEEYGNEIQPKWFPVFFTLSSSEQNTVTQIAYFIGQSHVSVIKIVAEMSAAGLIVEKISAKDRRKTEIKLSKKGSLIAKRIEQQNADVLAAVNEISSEASHDLWAALEEWERLLSKKSLLDRVIEIKQKRVKR